MSKYTPNQQVCEAIYADIPGNNPLLAAMPDMLSPSQFKKAIGNLPGLPYNLSQMSPEERQQSLALLSSVFVPMDYMYALYSQLYRAIRETYTIRTIIDGNRRTNDIFCNQTMPPTTAQAVSGSILGVPGIGKTSTICRALATMPQVLEHTECLTAPFYYKQVLYLKIECPSDCSIKALALNLVAALDRAIGSDYYNKLRNFRNGASSSIAVQMKILCMTHHVGLLLVDEIQNAVVTAKKNRQIKPLLKFLVELTNDTTTAVFFIGTPAVEEVFISQEHLKRRTRGIRLLPLKPDGTYRKFLKGIWPYQFTAATAPLTDKIANKLFDFSGGIPAYIMKIFKESQSQALLYGKKCIDERVIQQTIDILAIKIPKTYSGGTYLSDFEIDEIDTESGADFYLEPTPAAVNSCVPEKPVKQVRPVNPTETIEEREAKLPKVKKQTKSKTKKLTEINEPMEPVPPKRAAQSSEPINVPAPDMPVMLDENVELGELKHTEPIESMEPTHPVKLPEIDVCPEPTAIPAGAAPTDTGPVPRLYANQRGRKSIERDDLDMMEALQQGRDMTDFLREQNLLELIKIIEPVESTEIEETVQSSEPVNASASDMSAMLEGDVELNERNPTELIEPAHSVKLPEIDACPEPTAIPADAAPADMGSAPQLSANQRGRKSIERDDLDMMEALQQGCDIVDFLRKHYLLKEW